eukprot:Rhum_TRINITY_DN6117_c0_g1::Rhum_TRINITY_DN6117_c0_g1_i1::g.19185::m.19185
MEGSSSGLGAPEAFPGPDTTSDDAIAPASAPPPPLSSATSPPPLPPPPPPIRYRRVRYKAANAYDAFGLPNLPAVRGVPHGPQADPGAGLRDLLAASAVEGWSGGGGGGSAAAADSSPLPPPQRRTLYL